MDVLIESTSNFEKDLGRLSEDEKATTVKKINDCASLFPTQKADVYRKLRRLPLPSEINGQIHLKDIIEGQRHDDVIEVIKSKKARYE
ncbi:MAG: hypothetical protein HWQ35_14905 [Nostoc sp. NMS1]|uniref:hypothetical protein n=1 Tax=unclassified Nostoc TaxID=2593658 RepID=UPI0025F9B6C8|nr:MULTISPECIES: hypothetical protein [unclassified Nostoc]MBN3907795.1 hypothetical protein [Nostoc sp. NMS1]MBN3991194.1 hypothetical protein [Nostoc sp. NMS2]